MENIKINIEIDNKNYQTDGFIISLLNSKEFLYVDQLSINLKLIIRTEIERVKKEAAKYAMISALLNVGVSIIPKTNKGNVDFGELQSDDDLLKLYKETDSEYIRNGFPQGLDEEYISWYEFYLENELPKEKQIKINKGVLK